MEEIKLQTTQSLVPPVYYRLSAVPENQFAYVHYGVRHPGSIFSIHLSDTLTAFNALALFLNNLQAGGNPCSTEETEHLKSLTREFMFQLINYFESGYEIFLCFCEKLEKPRPREPLYKWFAKNGYEAEIHPYFTGVNPELERYRNFFNALKHSSNRTEIFQFINPGTSTKVLGFYLESVDEKGMIGPNLDFHPKHNDAGTAWSYNLHIRNFYFLIYKIAQEMDAAVQRLCVREGVSLSFPSAPLVPTGIEALSNAALVNTASRFEGVFSVFYPQESTAQVKTVLLDPARGSIVFSEYVAGNKVISRGKGWGALMTTHGDGFSRSFSLPYGPQKP
jgi:hypothetical protein